jgi:tight adherence protein C
MIYLFIITLFSFFLLISYYFFHLLFYHPSKLIKYRIHTHLSEKNELIYNTPLIFRVIDPIVTIMSELIMSITPKKYKQFLHQQIAILNLKYTIQQFLIMKVFIIVFTFIVVVGIPLLLLGVSPKIGIIIGILSYFIPDLLIQQQFKKRKKIMESELPLFIDLLSVIIEGGITFDNAIKKICHRKKGPLYDELIRYIDQIKIGTTKEDALRATADRLHISEFHSLSRAIIQGEKMGMSISRTLQIQATQIKQRRRERIREIAMKIPVKMMIPLVLFIFPPIFIVILGPGVIQIIEQLF